MHKKNISIIVLLIIILLITGGIYKKSQKNLIKKLQNTNTVQQKDLLTLTPTLSATPKYSVIIKSAPVHSIHGFSFEATVENVSVSPYITNFSFYECDFVDNNGKTYKGSLMDEKVMDKAILPGASTTLMFNDANATIKNLERKDYTTADKAWQECVYDEKGQNVCKYIGGIKITDCTAYISSAKKQAGNGWGEYPIKVNFL